jgi:flagellar FliL protein
MSEDSTVALPPPENGAKKSGGGSWVLTLGLLSGLAIATGVGGGLLIVSNVERIILEKHRAKSEEKVVRSPYSGDVAIKNLSPVITNLAGSESDWIRLESSIVYKTGTIKNPDVVAAEIRQDILAYLRTLSLAQIQGPSGLLHLREDLNERVKIRSKSDVQEIILETLIIQ